MGDQTTVTGHTRPVSHARRVALGGRQHVLVTVVDQFDRAARSDREKSRMTGDHVRILLLATEAATGCRLNDANLVIGPGEQRLHRLVYVVGALHGAENDQRSVLLLPGGDTVVLDVGLLLMRDPILPLHNEVRAPEAFCEIAFGYLEPLEDVVRSIQHGFPRKRFIDGQHSIERLVHDLDMRERLVGALPARVPHDEYRLFGVPHDCVSEKRLVALDEEHLVLARDVPGARRDELMPRKVRVEADAADPAAGNGRAQRNSVETVREVVGVDIFGEPAELFGTFLAW